MKFLKDCFTGKDNTTFDIGRVGFAFSMLAVTLFQLLEILKGQNFEPLAYSGAITALFIGFGIGQLAKSNTEPEKKK